MIGRLYPGRAGLRRQMRIDPLPGVVRAEVEDDFHNFVVSLHHRDGRITAVETAAPRHPWTSCPVAGPFLASQLVGGSLDDLPALATPLSHCTHMLDLAVVAAAHALDTVPICFDMFVGDIGESRRRAELWRAGSLAGSLIVGWDLEGDVIAAGPAAGRNLRHLREWLPEQPDWLHEPARLLRRAIFISGGRGYDYEHVKTAADIAMQAGACFTYQPARATQAFPVEGSKRDFTFKAEGEPVHQEHGKGAGG